MKKLFVIAGVVALAACSKAEAPVEADKTETAAAVAPAEESMAGTYDVTNADGTTGSTTVDADGNYVDMVDGKETARGTIKVTKGQTCFNSSEKGSAPECWTDGEPAADGSWVSTSDEGVKVTVKKREVAAAE
ncbi:MAG: hypothetical protein WAT93_06475 [Pontixanthobacter sp.]